MSAIGRLYAGDYEVAGQSTGPGHAGARVLVDQWAILRDALGVLSGFVLRASLDAAVD